MDYAVIVISLKTPISETHSSWKPPNLFYQEEEGTIRKIASCWDPFVYNSFLLSYMSLLETEIFYSKEMRKWSNK